MKYNSCRTFDFPPTSGCPSDLVPFIFLTSVYLFVPKQTFKRNQLISYSLHYIHLLTSSNMCVLGVRIYL